MMPGCRRAPHPATTIGDGPRGTRRCAHRCQPSRRDDGTTSELLASYTYDNAGRPSTLERLGGTGATTTWTWDDASRLNSIEHSSGSTLLGAVTYTDRDAAGFPTIIDYTTPASATSVNTPREIDEYSPARRLTAVCTDPTLTATACTDTAVTSQESWTYDLDGNSTGADATDWTQPDVYTYDNAGLLHTITGEHPATFTWDQMGNQLTETRGTVTTTREWDAAGRMVSVADGTNTNQYSYRPDGLRDSVSDGTTTSDWWWDPMPGGDGAPNLYAETNNDDLVVRRYLDDLTVENGIGTSRTWQITDALGTPLGWTENNGTPEGGTTYNAWGETTASWGSGQPVGFTGGHPSASGDVHLVARDYDPGTGLFRSDDPAGVDGNRYALGAPTNFSDPTGLCALWVFGEGCNNSVRKAWDDTIGDHWRGVLQVAALVAAVACVVVTDGLAWTACVRVGLALFLALEAQSAYDNLFARKDKCWLNFGRDTAFNAVSTLIPASYRVAKALGEFAPASNFVNGVAGGAVGVVLGNQDLCS